MSDISVSVIIPTYNSEKTLQSCLDSIRSDTTSYEYEIIIVDAGSKDATLEIAEPCVDRIMHGVPGRINRNIAIEVARGDIICFTDSDCIVPKGWMDGLVGGLLRLHAKDEKIVGVGGGNIPLLENPTTEELAVAETVRSPLVSFKARNVATYDKEREVNHNPPHNSAHFKRTLLEAGGFEEAPGYGYGEDSALDARLRQRGYKLYFLPGLCILHKHASSMGHFARQMFAYGWGRVQLGKTYKGYFKLHHYGPMLLCLMAVSPLSFIPWAMAVLNALIVTCQKRRKSLFWYIILCTMIFYVCYGAGELYQFLRYARKDCG